jgi:hypothetical protein
MENEIESSALPPVSSLRSRFEALSRGGGNAASNSTEETSTKQGSKFGMIGRVSVLFSKGLGSIYRACGNPS